MDLYLVRVASIIVIAAIYMLLDVFNKRNIPSVFAYGTLAYAVVLTLFYPLNDIITSSAIALIVIGIGYVVYKIGQLGAGDVIELAALSLIMPIQGIPVIANSISQYGLPFILSVLVNTGIVALIIVPIYYLPKAKRVLKKPLLSYTDKKAIFKTVALAVVYALFIIIATIEINISYIGVIILLLMLVSSCIVMIFSVPITNSMVEYVSPDKFEEGDIIAFNLMEQKEIDKLKTEVRGFDRLLTKDLINKIKEKKVKDKLPVYKEAMPFALAIFLGTILAIAIGNLIFFIFVI